MEYYRRCPKLQEHRIQDFMCTLYIFICCFSYSLYNFNHVDISKINDYFAHLAWWSCSWTSPSASPEALAMYNKFSKTWKKWVSPKAFCNMFQCNSLCKWCLLVFPEDTPVPLKGRNIVSILPPNFQCSKRKLQWRKYLHPKVL